MKRGIFFTHQGWTDIVNCLGLVGYYSKRYAHLDVLIREDSRPFIDFYLSQFDNVSAIYQNKKDLDNYHFNIPLGYDILFHGQHDRFRSDQFRFRFDSSSDFFVKKFYQSYGIDFRAKIEYFSIKRDLDLENTTYQNFIQSKRSDYILYHEDDHTPGGDTGIKLPSHVINNKKSINLNKITTNFFIFIKILQKSEQIHLVDSVWASIIYHLDCKYRLFTDIPIFIYPFKLRQGGLLDYQTDQTIAPIHPENWTIIK